MNFMNEWQLKIDLESNSLVKVEEYIKKKIPLVIQEFLVIANASYPKKDMLIVDNIEYILNNILNFNENSEESFFIALTMLKENINDFIPFAKDGFGNYYLIDFDDLKVYFYNHENNKIQYLSTFDTFIENLR